MSDDTVLTMDNGSKWRPSTSKELIHCATCDNAVDTFEELLSYPSGNCPNCGNSWTGAESKSTIIQVTMPESITGGAG